MLTSIKQRLGHDDEQGFTLIELMVVVLIIAILLAIAIPTFLGARNTANARAAQSDLRNALTAEQTLYANNQAFSATQASLQAIEPNLAWTATAATSVSDAAPNAIMPTLVSGDNVQLTVVGKDHNCYSVEQFNQPASPVASGTYYYVTPGTATAGVYSCSAPTAPAAAVSASHAGPASAPAWGLGW